MNRDTTPGFLFEPLAHLVPAAVRTPEVCPDTLTFARQQLGFQPDDIQARLLSTRSDRVILNCTRQWGKSTVTSIKALHVALTTPKGLIVCIARVQRQSSEFLMKVRAFAAQLGLPLRGDGANHFSLKLPNGARIVALPGTCEANIRGFSAVNLLIIDEASRVPDSTYEAVRPMLATTQGGLWVLSTPWTSQGFFYEEWTHSQGWQKFSVPATQCPRISPEFLEAERLSQGEDKFRRDYLCEFVDIGGPLYARELIEHAFTSQVAPLDLTTHNAQLTTLIHLFIGVDLGKKCDYAAIAIVERREAGLPHYLQPYNVPATYYDLRHIERLPLGTPYTKIVERIAQIAKDAGAFNRCTLVLDATGVGAPVVDLVRDANLRADLVPITITGGTAPSRSSHGLNVPKRDLMMSLAVMIENEELRIAADLKERKLLVRELLSIQADTYSAGGGKHDDLVFALALALYKAKAATIGDKPGRLF